MSKVPPKIEWLISNLLAAEDGEIIMDTCFSMIHPDDVEKEWRPVWRALKECWEKHRIIEPAKLWDYMNLHKVPAQMLTRIKNITWGLLMGSHHWQHYLNIYLDELLRRKAVESGKRLAGDPDVDGIQKLIDNEIDRLQKDRTKYTMSPYPSFGDLLGAYLDNVDKAHTQQGANVIKTGLWIDKYIGGGFRPGDYMLLAGRPKMGKSMVANTIMCNVVREGKRVMLVNMEMSYDSIINRMMANLYGFDISELSNPEVMSEYVIGQLMSAVEDIRKLPINIYAMNLHNTTKIITELDRLIKIDQKPDLLVLDYLQLIKPKNEAKSIYERITNLSWEIKTIAATRQVPVLALSQLNRNCEARENKRPQVSDLRDSGALEQDASAVMFIYRDEVYHSDTPEPGIAEIEVAINRNGTTGKDKYVVNFDRMNIGKLTYQGEPK